VNNWKPVAVGVILIGLATAPVVPMMRHTRSVRPSVAEPSAAPFDPRRSAGLFVGVRTFTDGSTPEVPYAVDDAIDLAYTFACDRRVHLVTPRNVILALAGAPQKPESRQRLRELIEEGAEVHGAEQLDELLERQAVLAGRDGLLIASFATHGFVEGGISFVLGSEKTYSMATMLDRVAAHGVPRSLIVVDACKERNGGARGAGGTVLTPLMQRMPRIQGQVLLSVTGLAYDDPRSCNGVFTRAVIDGLNCKATSPRCQVTAETLAQYVERTVRKWIRVNRNPNVRSATQINVDGEARNMPLAQCCVPAAPKMHITSAGSVVTVSSAGALWSRDVGHLITSTTQAGAQVIVGTDDSLIAFGSDGTRTWTVNEKRLHACAAGDLFRKHNDQIVALWGSRLSIYEDDGSLHSAYEHPEELHHVAICRATPHHAPRVIVAGTNRVLAFDPKKIGDGKPLWCGRLFPSSETIASVNVADCNRDTKEDIVITTASGATLNLDYAGNVIGRSPVAFRPERSSSTKHRTRPRS
jgi:ribonuclease HI